MANANQTLPSAPKWSNWSGNIVHEPPTGGEGYYYRPTNLAELKSVLAAAAAKGVTRARLWTAAFPAGAGYE
jgi:hypothetical protein